jgi:hypothetical protein
VSNSKKMDVRVFDGMILSADSVAALEIASSRCASRLLGTFDVLAALLDVDQAGDWAWLQLESAPIVAASAHLFRDADMSVGGTWHNVPLTVDACKALRVAEGIGRRYGLVPLPPGAIAIGLVWDESSGAARALLASGELPPGRLLELVQDAILGTRLVGLTDERGAVPSVEEDPAAAVTRQLLDELRAAAAAIRHDTTNYVVLTTGALMCHMAERDLRSWTEAAEHAQISGEAYLANLRWVRVHQGEKLDTEIPLDADLPGIRLTAELGKAISAARKITIDLSASEIPEAKGILAACLLSMPGCDACCGLTESSRLKLRIALLQILYGAQIPDLDLRFQNALAPDPGASVVSAGRAKENKRALAQRSSQSNVGLSIGTYIGSFLVAGIGGLPWSAALIFAWLVRTAAARARKRRVRGQKFVAAAAALALVGGIWLVATGSSHFNDERHAVKLLSLADAAIDQDALPTAMRDLGGAGLYENDSVAIRVLGSCVDWSLGFEDFATLEAQEALNDGYRPYEASHYRGRACFLDTLFIHGLAVMKTAQDQWLIFPVPDRTDSTGVRLMQIADQERNTSPPETYIALGCLADRYDFREYASYMFTVGLNLNELLGGHASPFAEIRTCLGSQTVRRGYKSVVDPTTGADSYFPVDTQARIPSPARPHPPAGVCWARFPLGGPCKK